MTYSKKKRRPKQINLQVGALFEGDLTTLMKVRGFQTKTEAIRAAVHEAAQKASQVKQNLDFRQWIGLALKAPLNAKPQFQTEDDLWLSTPRRS